MPFRLQRKPSRRGGNTTAFLPLVEKVAPGVVTVSTTQAVSRGATSLLFSHEDDTFSFGSVGRPNDERLTTKT